MIKPSKEQAKRRIEKLRQLIDDYRYHYHVLDQSIMSEAAADSLKHELSLLEEYYPELITPDSPSQRVAGTPLSKFVKATHSSRMLSLNDVFDFTELQAWQSRITKLIEEPSSLNYFMDIKMDGFACALIYQDGSLVQAITRGDGFVGEDVTANVRTIDSVPLNLRDTKENAVFLKGRTEVRGEIVMYKKDFDELNVKRAKANLPLFANPRNTAAGTVRQLNPKLVLERPLKFHAYDLRREIQNEVPSFNEAYKILRQLGFLANKVATLAHDIEQVKEFANKWESARQELPFNTDGLVVKVDNRAIYERLGIVGKAPRGAVAYKYPAEQSTTVVRDIFVSIGRTGAATPVAVLDPVVVAGSTVQMATLHNESEVARKDIRIGDTVIIHKAGDIIPEVVEPLVTLRTGAEKQFVMPVVCPECDTTLTKTKVDEAVWRCPNVSCPARAQRHIEHFASRGALDIEGLGSKNVASLLEAGLISDQADIYNLNIASLLTLDRFAKLSASKLISAINAKKQPPLARFLFGLGIRHVGVQTAIDLANHFKTLSTLSNATVDQLLAVEGVGEVVAEAIVVWFEDPVNQRLLDKFIKYQVLPLNVEKVNGPLNGKRFVITGTLQSMGREQAAQKIRDLGGTFASSIGRDTSYLVVGSNVGTSKLTKAQKLDIKQISEDQLIQMFK